MENKYQEALDRISTNFGECEVGSRYYDLELNIDISTLQKLVDKEKPKKVFLNKECQIIQCPTCKVAFMDYIKSPFGNTLRHTKRCDDCGQVLDWSDKKNVD